MIGVGEVPPDQSQLAKFAGVQDRLRAWRPDVLAKLKHFSCMEIAMLDIDGFRMDKALQTTIDVQAEWSNYMRQCARDYGKENFLIIGECVGKMPFGSIYFGRGKEPDMQFDNVTEAQLATGETNTSTYLREFGMGALDGEAFHYPTYGALTRFLGLDGLIGIDGVDFVALWNRLLRTNDMVNSNTGKFDPRHMFGVTNQDVFRWPALANGTHRQNLGFFITILEMPGIPWLLWGEEQEHRSLENIAGNYIFGRSPMASSRGWQAHACYKVGASGNGYAYLPFDSALSACGDDNISLDHRDPSHPLRNIIKRMYEIRRQFPVMNDGYTLQTLSTQLTNIFLPGSNGMPSPTGLWSVYRGRTPGIQDFTDGQGNQGVWLVFSNDNVTKDYKFNCQDANESLLTPFPVGTIVKNLMYPYEEITLGNSSSILGIEGSSEYNGCLSNMTMPAWGYKAFVPKPKFVEPGPTITKFIPGHDSRLLASVPPGEQQSVPFQIEFSTPLDCQSIVNGMSFQSDTHDGTQVSLNISSVQCSNMDASATEYVGQPASMYSFSAILSNVSHGVHSIYLRNITTSAGDAVAVDRFMFRLGALDNPMVFPTTSNYTNGLLSQNDNGSIIFHPTAAGAEQWRYSTNWGSSYSDWVPYTGNDTVIEILNWTGTKDQEWYGTHIITQYWSDMTGSSDHVQHSDLGDVLPRRWPHVHFQGDWNQFGYDGGLNDSMVLDSNGWYFDITSEWPSYYIINIWGMNPDGVPDKTAAYGDVDGDNILDFLPPDSLAQNTINITQGPGMPYVGYRLRVNDGSYRYTIEPAGSYISQVIIFVLLAIVPLLTGSLAVLIFMRSFYKVKFNKTGFSAGNSWESIWSKLFNILRLRKRSKQPIQNNSQVDILGTAAQAANSRNVIIGTMEYEIADWDIKVKIGGLGVMANLMGKHLKHLNLIWVVPCVGGIDYPVDTPSDSIFLTIMGAKYEVSVQHHKYENITYVLLDAPVFRKQTKAEPYPPRMDDMESAIYYSAWNQCIAEVIRRFPEIDLYHINDYHGAVAPLYLLPRVIPCCLSLHNAEFQGLWSLSTKQRANEISRVFNLNPKLVESYVQWNSVFNLLHAGASYLRKHQNGFGAVGVSKKYGKRSFERYPIFWGLKNVGALPNPDPADTGFWDKKLPDPADIKINHVAEAQRGTLRRQAQEWAGLRVDDSAELFVFVGRWSKQKGVDIIADVFPSILKSNSKVQLICIGPVIDLYGKFAALKLQRLMEIYPGRVYSKPEFTAIPPYVFSGAEFALIPSRDEPFGLVAVEFGRKGALGVGSRVGGLGQMPGWWFTIESSATKHLISQFKSAIKGALASSYDQRVVLRARSSMQRFPVAQWMEDLEILQLTAIKMHNKVLEARRKSLLLRTENQLQNQSQDQSVCTSESGTTVNSRPTTAFISPAASNLGSANPSRAGSREPSPSREVSTTAWNTLHKRLNSIKSRSSGAGKSLNNVGEIGTQDFASNGLYTIQSREHAISSRESGSTDDNSSDAITPAPLSTSHPPVQSDTRASSVISPINSGTTTPATSRPGLSSIQSASVLSLQSVIGTQKNFELQNVDASFNDPNGFYTRRYEKMLTELTPKTSESDLCIEDYIIASEKNWHKRYADVKLGRSGASTPTASVYKLPLTRRASSMNIVDTVIDDDKAQFQLSNDYKPPTGIEKIMQHKIGDWPVYAFFLALGQIVAANSYQITLLTGQNGQSANMLYAIASIYLASSIFWWFLYRRAQAVYVLATPFLFYGAAFFILGMTPYGSSIMVRGWIQNVATGIYAIASASGALFFALNFGTEGGTPTQTWCFRACVIQGSQLIYVTILWFWGAYLTDLAGVGIKTSQLFTSTPIVTAITTPIAVLFWIIAVLLYIGLPSYYRALPGKVPYFHRSLPRRKIVVWFMVAVVLQNYWLSAPYGRNWRYLWSSTVCPSWAIVILVLVFFVGVWAGVLSYLAKLSEEHSWFMPIFAMGLGAPRWCQMLWATSGMGAYLPWAGSQVTGVLLGRGLWLWLGVLDSLQGIGFGMTLLQTLTRFHIAFALVAGQVLGSLATIVARATAPDRVGPGPVFPNLLFNVEGLKGPFFWVGLGFQVMVPIGFFLFFRREQLFKP
jgi:alpha-1,3-glucan synthase